MYNLRISFWKIKLRYLFSGIILLFSLPSFAAFSLSSIAVSNINTNSAEISWKTNLSANSKVEYGLSSSLALSETAVKYDATNVLSHKVLLSGLQPNSKYYYRISSKSKTGSYAVSSIRSFQTASTSQAYTISNIYVDNVQPTAARIVFTTNRAGTAKVIYSTSSSLPDTSLIVYDATMLSNHVLSLINLQPSTTYYYRVSSADVNGAYAESTIRSFTTLAAPTVPVGGNIPMTSIEWMTAYDGYGFVTFDASTGSVVFAPQAPDPSGPVADISNTHAVLLLSNRHLLQPLRNFRITVDVTTEQQLRTPTPNAWEVFWLFFNYTTDSAGKKKTNYFTVKPSGMELGTAFDEVGQKFLLSKSTPTLLIGKRSLFVVEKRGLTVKAWMDGVLIMDYNNVGAVDPLYDVAGTIGLYSEDARVRVHSVSVDPL